MPKTNAAGLALIESFEDAFASRFCYNMSMAKARFEDYFTPGFAAACWNWQGYIRPNGYGQFGRKEKAHRVAWTTQNGPIPEGLCVLHKCDNRACVNPQHLFLGTYLDNNLDMLNKGRGRAGGPPGERAGRAKLTDAAIAEILSTSGRGSGLALARKYGVSPSAISCVRVGKTWGHLAQN